MSERLSIGDLVRVKHTLLYNGRVGTLAPTSDDPEDIWDYYVTLLPDPSDRASKRVIGVTTAQIEKEAD